MLLFLAGCASDDFEPKSFGVCPEVTSTDPANQETNVLPDQIIQINFNTEIDPATITSSSVTVSAMGAAISGTLQSTGSTVTFTPSVNLAPDTTYTGKVFSSVTNSLGLAMLTDYVWSFSTGDVLTPVVIETDPENLETNVVLNKTISATFSEAMAPSTISNSSFTLKNGTTAVSGTVNYSGVVATFDPTVDLDASTTYTATITTEATNLDGISLQSDYVWTFTTGALTAPTVISTNPTNQQSNVAINADINATFSRAMAPGTINNASFLLMNGGTAVSGSITYSGVTATFNPAQNLTPNTTYTATITTAAQSSDGVALQSDYVWTFTTGALTAPTVIATNPADQETNVPLNTNVTATFNRTMAPGTINSASFLLMDGNNAVSGTVTYSGVVATFNPSQDLNGSTTYTATITRAAQSSDGVALQSDFVWTFTTRQAVAAPNLGSVKRFGTFGGNAGITNQGLFTEINNGRIGTTAASTLVTGFHDEMTGDIYTETPLNVGGVSGGIFTAPPAPGTATSFAIAQQGLQDANDLYLAISPASMPGGSDPGAGELGGLTLPPGVYKAASGTFGITNGDLVLDAQGDPNAVWVFQTDAGLTVGTAGPAGARSVRLINGASSANVFWYVGSAATINGAGGGVMEGTIVSSAGVTLSTPGNVVLTVLNGRAISLVASVTMVNTIINVPN